jgi:hypothetical protein
MSAAGEAERREQFADVDRGRVGDELPELRAALGRRRRGVHEREPISRVLNRQR